MAGLFALLILCSLGYGIYRLLDIAFPNLFSVILSGFGEHLGTIVVVAVIVILIVLGTSPKEEEE